MRRNNFAWVAMPIAALCLTMMAGCSSSDDVVETPAAGTRTLTFNAALGEDNTNTGTRAGVLPNNTDESKETFIWHAGDQFKASLLNTAEEDYEETKPVFSIADTYSDGSPTNSASFSCPDFPNDREYKMVATYPYPKEIYIFELATNTTQTGRNTTYHLKDNMLMYATATVPVGATVGSLKFHHLTSLFRFTVSNNNASACRIKQIKVTSTDWSFGYLWSTFVLQNYDGSKIPTDNIGNSCSETYITLNLQNSSTDTQGIELAANGEANDKFDAYMCSGPANSLTDQTLTFTLTVTDADGTNERTYTSLALDADRIIAANNNATTFEAGKRYWFNLMLDSHQLTANITAVTPWGDGTPADDTSSEALNLSELCKSATYKAQREALTAITLNGTTITADEKTNYMQGNFATYFPRVTTINLTGSTIAQTHMFQGITQVKTINGESLTALPASAFEGNTDAAIESLNLPNVESVGDYCFKYCGKNLLTLSLPKATTVGTSSFSYNTQLLHACFASLEDFATASDIFGYSDKITDLAFGTLNQMTFASEAKKVFGGPMIQGTAANTTLYLNETGYEYQNNVSGSTWRGITFKAIKKYSEYPYKKD